MGDTRNTPTRRSSTKRTIDDERTWQIEARTLAWGIARPDGFWQVQSAVRLVEEGLREILLLGRDMEASGDHLEALELYNEALATYDEARGVEDGDVAQVEVGSILRHAGDCATAVGDGRRALVDYVTAARLFHRHGLPGYCADSLAAAGMAVVRFGSDYQLERVVAEEVVRLGLDDVLSHARDVLLAAEAPTYEAAIAVHGRLSGLLVVAGQAGYDEPLATLASALAFEVVKPFIERHRVADRLEMDDYLVVALLFQGLAKLCLVVTQQEEQWRRGEHPSPARIQLLADILGEAFVGPPHEPMARWLGALLRGRHGCTDVSDADLIAFTDR